MNTQEFICQSLGCTPSECEFIDGLTDEKFPSFDLEEEEVTDFDINIVWQNGYTLCNFLIDKLYNKIIRHYVDLGLDEDKFDTDINSVCSDLYYNGEIVYEENLDNLVNNLD